MYVQVFFSARNTSVHIAGSVSHATIRRIESHSCGIIVVCSVFIMEGTVVHVLHAGSMHCCSRLKNRRLHTSVYIFERTADLLWAYLQWRRAPLVVLAALCAVLTFVLESVSIC
jgi:hypothetical protein